MSAARPSIEVLPIRRALVAVADKDDLDSLGRRLAKFGVELVSTGNTAAALREAGVTVTPVAEVTGVPEMLGGRVKSLHPRIHGGILADKRRDDHVRELEEHGIEPFDLVIANLYPFTQTVLAGAGDEEVVEQIDIGGPAMVRAAAKNFESVGVLVKPGDYPAVLDEIEREGGLTRSTRLRLARRAFEHVAAYDAAVAAWFGDLDRRPEEDVTLPEIVTVVMARRSELRYGENPHQRGGLYAPEGQAGPLGGAEVVQGREMSFNNWLDAEAARATVALLEPPAAVIVKHHNPCGAARGPTLAGAYRRALECDPTSAFGGIVAFNAEVDEATAGAMADVFTEVVVAPSFSDGALEVFAGRTKLRVLRAPGVHHDELDVRLIEGGALVQDADRILETKEEMKVVTTTEPTAAQWDDLVFAWTIASRAKSNAIVLARDLATVGVGAGQMNRLTSVDIAARNAGKRARGSSLASDAFFPFRDGLDRAGEAGIAAVIQPGGSVRDEEVIAAAEEHGMAMVFTGRRHFRH